MQAYQENVNLKLFDVFSFKYSSKELQYYVILYFFLQCERLPIFLSLYLITKGKSDFISLLIDIYGST